VTEKFTCTALVKLALHFYCNSKTQKMRTISSRNTSRGHGDRRRDNRDYDEFSTSGMEDGWRNEDYYFDADRARNGYWNRDYSGNNYWAGRDDVRDERFAEENDYVPSLDYGSAPRRRGGTYGYGNEGSSQMRDFERWRESGNPEGYAGRNANDYRQGYGDHGSYDPYRGHRSQDDTYYPSRREDYDPRAGEDNGRYSYGDYESYPAYEARGYRPAEYHSWESNRFRNGGDRSRREFGREHRPYIREKRY
jgi:hypothetical protein